MNLVGLKISSAQREYYRYTGISADIERRGAGKNSLDFTRLVSREERQVQINNQAIAVDNPPGFRSPARLTACKNA